MGRWMDILSDVISAKVLTRGDCHAAQQLAELLIIAHRQLDVAGNDARLLVVTCGISGQLQDLRGQVLQDCTSVLD